MNDIKLETAEKVVEQHVNELTESKYYKSIDIHFGVKSRSGKDYSQ